MAAKMIDRPLTFAVPQVGRTAILPQQAALGTIAKIVRRSTDSFVVLAYGTENVERRFYIVRADRNGWSVEHSLIGPWRGQSLAWFRADRLREALAWAVRYVTADWIIEVRDGGFAR